MITTHPEYIESEWSKYRYIKDGGDDFIAQYLVRFSSRETNDDFDARKQIAPIPGFANAALVDIRNSIYQRMCDITRKGGSQSFRDAIMGLRKGVDLKGATMNHFIGREVLPELLFMGKVGVYIDMPVIGMETKKEAKDKHPYIYIYKAEEIKNWVYAENSSGGVSFERVLLQETYNEYDDLGLPKEVKVRYRLMIKDWDGVIVKYLDENGKEYDEHTLYGIKEIPFVLFELDRSLLKDVANHQLALLNLESSDISYSLKANFPFYTEQYSGKFDSSHLKDAFDDNEDDEVEVGNIQGRRYGKGLNAPAFIHPSSEPILASIEKQKQLKEDIRSLINLALSSIRPKFASAEAKQFDERGLESGLSFLGLVLEHGEQQIANFYHQYENDDTITIISYPERYGLKTDLQRMEEAERLNKLTSIVPSKRYQKEMAKEVVKILLGAKVTMKDFDIMLKEIEDAKYMTSDPETIHSDVERGIVSLKTAAQARGYSDDEPKKAEEDHAKRLMRIQAAQTHDTNNDTIVNPDSAKAEKEASQDPDKKE